MAGGYGVAEILGDAIEEELIAEVAGLLFGVAFAGGEGGGVKWEVVLHGQETSDEGFIGVGFRAAEFVIDMEHGGRAVELMESCEEEDGIGPAGDSYGDFFVGQGESGRDAIKHTLILRRVPWLRYGDAACEVSDTVTDVRSDERPRCQISSVGCDGCGCVDGDREARAFSIFSGDGMRGQHDCFVSNQRASYGFRA